MCQTKLKKKKISTHINCQLYSHLIIIKTKKVKKKKKKTTSNVHTLGKILKSHFFSLSLVRFVSLYLTFTLPNFFLSFSFPLLSHESNRLKTCKVVFLQWFGMCWILQLWMKHGRSFALEPILLEITGTCQIQDQDQHLFPMSTNLFGYHLFCWNWKFFTESTVNKGKS